MSQVTLESVDGLGTLQTIPDCFNPHLHVPASRQCDDHESSIHYDLVINSPQSALRYFIEQIDLATMPPNSGRLLLTNYCQHQDAFNHQLQCSAWLLLYVSVSLVQLSLT